MAAFSNANDNAPVAALSWSVAKVAKCLPKVGVCLFIVGAAAEGAAVAVPTACSDLEVIPV